MSRRLYHDYGKNQPIFGCDMERGELPNDLELIGQIVADICYNNALDYFGITLDQKEGV
ncbi:MAG: glucuronate isomerase [Desulfatirhabdiaceae bacterium]|jgi:hypothetical protein|nr:glucuronate isomerase [Desulfatirhabdiaceae bacterium]